MTALAAFLASFVEAVEALTVVLAVAAVDGASLALAGMAAALALLGVLVATLGPALGEVDLPSVRLVVGVLVLAFGLRWLRKAVRRAQGRIPLRDENAAFARIRAERQGGGSRAGLATVFNAVLLEGAEVVFIVLAAGAGGRLGEAAWGAALAVLAVAALGAALHRPLARVPENTLKFVAGAMLCGLGSAWALEGAGLALPGGAAALPAAGLAWLLGGIVAVRLSSR